MSLRTTDFLSLTRYLDEVVNEATVEKVAAMDVADMLFDTSTYVRKDYIYRVLHGIKGVSLVPEGSDLPRATGLQGDGITFTNSQYGAQVPITKALRLFDLEGEEMAAITRSIVDDGMDKIDQSLADVLLNGHSSSAYTDVYGISVTPVGPDGDPLFTATHSNGATSATYSNLAVNSAGTTNQALSRDTVVATRVKGLVYKDVNNLTRPVMLDTLIVSPNLEDLAERTLYSTQIPGEANNDINALKGKIKKLCVWPRLQTSGQGTDTSNRWYMCDSKAVKKTLKARFAQKPIFAAPTVHDNNMDWQYNYDYFYFKGFGFAPYIFGSSKA